MNIYIYSDESGVLDKAHNKYFVFGGLIFLSKHDRDNWARLYTKAEKTVRNIENIPLTKEIKASNISNKSKGKLYRALNKAEKFCVVISQDRLNDNLFLNKKGKQRYLDWAFKMAVKLKLEDMIRNEKIIENEVQNLYFYVDEHSTATNGIYELRESLEQEFKFGNMNFKRNTYHPPIFSALKSVELKYCDSATNTLVRASDIVANHIFYLANSNNGRIEQKNNLNIFYHPYTYR